jgi:predicted lipase
MKNFKPTTTEYDGNNALALAYASHLAYHDRDAVQLQAGQWGFSTFHWFDQDTTQGYLMANDRAIVLVFRGTEMRNLRDWLTNSQVGKRPLVSEMPQEAGLRDRIPSETIVSEPSYKRSGLKRWVRHGSAPSVPSSLGVGAGASALTRRHQVRNRQIRSKIHQTYGKHRRTDRHAQGQVHKGFWKALQAVWVDLCTVLAQVRDRQQPIYITGHSLGGALAILAAAQLVQAGHPVQGVYTYGAPRVGNRKFRQQFNQHLQDRTFRLVNDEDIVPCLPAPSLGYVHTGQVFHFSATGEMEICCDRQTRRLHQLSYGVLRWLDGNLEEVKDHAIDAYETCLLRGLSQA